MRILVAAHDLCALAVWIGLATWVLSLSGDRHWRIDGRSLAILTLFGYLVGTYFTPVLSDRHPFRTDSIFRRSMIVGAVICVFYLAMESFLKLGVVNLRHNLIVAAVSPLVIFVSRILTRFYFRTWCAGHSDHDRLVLVGDSSAMNELRRALDAMPEAKVDRCFSGVDDGLFRYLEANPVNELYCDFSLARGDLSRLYRYCEGHFVRFFGVPNTDAYLNRRLLASNVADVPVLALREEPLLDPVNRFVKRAFDVIVSLVAIPLVVLPVMAVSAIVIKLTSPGPVLFRQRRTGMDGRVFTCLKLRTMRLNDESDDVQATSDDPRKYPYGSFLRRTNLDELPQFVNVLRGEMSVVGPRPHMLKHTEQYGALIERYMVRHLAKPGITGWAQVNGLRGVTKSVEDMERRVRFDIWYIEHWSFGLDLAIIIRTAFLTLLGKCKNAY